VRLHRLALACLSAVAVTLSLLGLYLAGLRPPFFSLARSPWAIGIYGGSSPFELELLPGIENPVLTAADVSDVRARFVADPFLVRQGEGWLMFFEIMNEDSGHGDVGLARSPDGREWHYEGVVLDEPFHLSYPAVFENGGEHFMVPESVATGSIRLYRATSFPRSWSLEATLLSGGRYADPTLFQVDGSWWLFAETNPELRYDTLRLFHAEQLHGPWAEHPHSPIVQGDASRARPAGGILQHDGRIFRVTQDDGSIYGEKVRVFEVTTLSRTAYAEHEITESPVLAPSGSFGWNSVGMHQLSLGQTVDRFWLAAVDGFGRQPRLHRR